MTYQTDNQYLRNIENLRVISLHEYYVFLSLKSTSLLYTSYYLDIGIVYSLRLVKEVEMEEAMFLVWCFSAGILFQ